MDRTDGSIRFRPVAGTHWQDAMTTARNIAQTALMHVSSLLVGLVLLGLPACQTAPPLNEVPLVAAPYRAVIAVAPFSNESGVSISLADIASVSDKIVTATNGTVGPDGAADGGWRAVPLDRTLAAMRQLGITSVRTEADAQAIIRTIPVDGLILGTLTEWGPYDPPDFGANILFIGDDARLQTALDATGLYGKTGDTNNQGPSDPPAVRPISDLVIELDAVNHRVRSAVRTFAESHTDVTGGFDPPERYYLMVYDRYLDFVADRIVSGLAARERQRAANGG